MGRIYKELLILGDKGYAKVKALFDTGADESIIRSDIANKVATVVDINAFMPKLQTANGKILDENKLTTIAVELDEGCNIGESFRVFDNLNEEMIIGHNIMQKRDIVLDMSNDTIDTKNCRVNLRL